jgi:hypothetical protein
MKIIKTPTIDIHEVISTFEKLTGWESDIAGEWNCKFDKPITFKIDFEGNFEESSSPLIVYALESSVTKNPKSTLTPELRLYKNNILRIIPITNIVNWLIVIGEIDAKKGDLVLITNF